MRNKISIAAVSIVLAFFIGSVFGLGYYQFSQGTTVVSATPLEPSPPAKPLETEPGENQKNENIPVPVEPETGSKAERDDNDLPETVGESTVLPNPPNNPSKETGVGHQKKETEEKVAYITIDDGPDANNTPAILEILEEFGVKATFFVLGTSAEKNPDLIKQIHEAGHTIGNHTYNHRYKETYDSDQSFWNSVKKTEEIIFNIIGARPTLIREPGGKFRTMPEKQQMIRDEGYGLVHWNIDSYDSRSPVPNAETIFTNVKRQAEKEHLWPAMVILFHESGGHKSTVEALPSVIQYLHDEGFSLKPVVEMDLGVMANLPKP